MGIKAGLHRYELYLYIAVLAGALAWAASWIVEASSGEWLKTNSIIAKCTIFDQRSVQLRPNGWEI